MISRVGVSQCSQLVKASVLMKLVSKQTIISWIFNGIIFFVLILLLGLIVLSLLHGRYSICLQMVRYL